MTEPRHLLDDYAAEEASCCGQWFCGTTPREDLADKAFAALRAVLAYCNEVERVTPIAALELRGRITAALRDGGDSM